MKLITILGIVLLFNFSAWCQFNSSDNINSYRQISDLLQKGIEKALNNNITESHNFFEEAYQQSLSQQLNPLIPLILIAHSRLYLIEEKYDEALDRILKAEKYIEENPKNSLAGDYYEFLGQCYIHQQKFELALENLKKSEEIRKVIEPGKNWRTYNGMARIYKSLNKIDLSEKFSEQASKLSKIQNSRRIILDMQNELKFDEQSGTIAYLSHENLKSKVELQKAKFKNLLLIICLVTSVIISILLIIILKQRNRYNKEIAEKNEIISKNLSEKESLLQEIHHRVKNNLQVISSLLSLQSRSLEDKSASEALMQSQSRVISMSLIHETLYKDGPSSILDLGEYLTNLSQQIFNTYNIDGDKIRLHLDLKKINVDVGILVPIGLIVNELITNSLKYAFQGKDSGNIWIISKKNENQLIISIKDDGIGSELSLNEKGFGNKLIDTFAKKLNAKIDRIFNLGSEITLSIQTTY